MSRGIPRLKAVYTLPELARMSGNGRKQIARILAGNGVPIRRLEADNPRSMRIVILRELRTEWPEFWESILDRLSVMAHVADNDDD